MKRSRVFLGITTACLAIAGAVAAKATHFDPIPGFYLTAQVTGAGHPYCLPEPRTNAPCVYDNTGGQTCVTTLTIPVIGNVNYKLYTAPGCVHAFTYQDQE